MACAEPSQKCGINEIRAAIPYQTPLIAHEIKERFKKSRAYLTAKIPDGGYVDPADDGRTLIMGNAYQAPVGYRSYEDNFVGDCGRPLVPGTMDAESGCGGCGSEKIPTMITPVDSNACDGVCVVDFAQGYRIRGAVNRELKISTPERCIETLAKLERKLVAQYIEKEAMSLADVCVRSYEHLLFNLIVERGGANSVVRGFQFGEPVLTTGGWDLGDDPNDPINGVKHVSLYYLERYRDRIVEEIRHTDTGLDPESFILEVEVTREAWKAMLIADALQRSRAGGILPGLGGNIQLDEKVFERGNSLEGRKFDIWNGKIKAVFNEEPMRAYARATGVTPSGGRTFELVLVPPYINVPDEQAGLRSVTNPDYNRNFVRCDGFEYPLFELIPNINDKSFVRHGLTQGVGPKGVKPGGTNFEIQLLTGAQLSSSECPNYGDKKYRYYTEHKIRMRDVFPELSGFILHRRNILPGYDVDFDNNPLVVRDGLPNTVPQQCDNCVVEKCHPECPEEGPCLESDNLTELKPCGAVTTGFYGDPSVVRLSVCRDSKCNGVAATVSYEISDATAANGTHFIPVDAMGNAAPAIGTLEWAANECGCKEILVRIIGALADTPAPAPGPCCEPTHPTKNDAVFNVTVVSATGTTLADCTSVEVSIRNRQ